MTSMANAGGRNGRPARAAVLPLFLLLTLAAFLLDWTTKSWALSALAHGSLPLGPLTLGVARNEGFAFSAGSGVVPPWLIVAARVGVLAVLALFAFRLVAMTRRHAAGMALLFAGGLGNAADLVFRGGAVVDFIGAGPYTVTAGGALYYSHFVFNVADVLIFAGLFFAAPLIGLMGRQVRQQLGRAAVLVRGTAST